MRGWQRAVVAGADMQRVGAGFGGPDGDLFSFGPRQAAREEILDRQPVNHRRAGDRGLDGAQYVEPETRAVYKRAAVVVGAAVFERRAGMRGQGGQRGQDLDAVVTGPSVAPRPP